MSRFVIGLFMAFALVFATSSLADDSNVSPKWDYDVGSRVDSIAIGDVGSDGVTELVVASDDSIIVFSGDGKIIKNYSVSFTPSVVYVIGGDIVVGSGDIKTTNITNPVFNFTDKDNIVQIPSVVYKTIRNIGDVYVISGNSQPRLFLRAGNWVRDIQVEDMDGDLSPDYAVAVGGINVDFIQNANLEDSPRELVKQIKMDSDVDRCDNITDIIRADLSDSVVQCQFIDGKNYMDINVTPGFSGLGTSHFTYPSKDDQCSEITEVIKSYFRNMTVTCEFFRRPSNMGGGRRVYYAGYMEINYTQPPRLSHRWVYTKEEAQSENGSMYLFSSNGTIILNQSFSYVPSYVSLVSFTTNSSRMLAVGSEPIDLLDLSGSVALSYDSPEENYTVKALFFDSVRGEKTKDIVAGFEASKVSGVFVLDRAGELVWAYKVPGEDYKGLTSKDIESDGVKEIIFSTEKGVYVIGNDGLLRMSFSFAKSIDKLAVGDIDGNKYMDFAVASGQRTYVYEVDEAFIKSGLANKYYTDARASLSLGEYDDALSSVKKAADLYEALSDDAGVSMSASLLSEIKESMKGVRNETASSLYKKGRAEYYLGNYNLSWEYLEKALEIYDEIGDVEGRIKTEKAISELKEADGSVVTSTIVAPTNAGETTSTTNKDSVDTPEGLPSYIPILAGLIIVFMLVLIVKMFLAGRGPKEKPREKDTIQRS